MNKIIFRLIFTCVFVSQPFLVSSQSKTTKKILKTSFKVLGNCEMCEKKIEEAVLNLNGVKKAEWDKDMLLLKVKYNLKQVQLFEIKQAVANVGYDTDTIKATDENYNALHYCCKYDRKQ
ncbi:MAG: heavy-metal-associated domain-containing protein [Flavobacteriales bacterium]